jgi:hypothetical protein
MHQQNILLAAGLGCKKLVGLDGAFVQQLLGNELVFEHRKTVTFGQRMGVQRVVSNFEHGVKITIGKR